MVSTEQAKPFEERSLLSLVLYMLWLAFYSLEWWVGIKISLLKHISKMEKTGVYGSHKQRQSQTLIKFWFQYDWKRGSQQKKKAGAEGTTQEVTLNTQF